MAETEKHEGSGDDRQVKPFAAWLQEQRGGTTHAELSSSLPELIEAVTTFGKAGELVLRVKVKPADGDRGAVIVHDEVVLKKPQSERHPTMFFVDEDHNLTRENPFSKPFPQLREVPSGAANAADAKEATP